MLLRVLYFWFDVIESHRGVTNAPERHPEENQVGKRTRITKKQLKHDALLETTASATKFIEENLNKVLIGVLAIVLVIVVVMMITRSQHATETVAAGELATATQTMNAGMYTQAADQLQAIIDRYAGTRSAAAATCYLGSIAFQQGQYDEALRHFDDYLARHSGNHNLDRTALEGKASVLEQRRDFTSAAALYEQLADDARKESGARARYFTAAVRNYRSAGDWSAVSRVAQTLIDENPGTPWESQARMDLAEARTKL